MTATRDSVSLSEINTLMSKFEERGLDLRKLSDVLDSTDPVAAFGEMLSGESMYPLAWGPAELHLYKFDTKSRYNWPEYVSLEQEGVKFISCADCITHTWVYAAQGKRRHLSKKMSDFIQVSSNLQVKATQKGLLIRRPIVPKGIGFCSGAAD